MLFEFGGPYNFYFIFVHWWVGCWVLLGRENSDCDYPHQIL